MRSVVDPEISVATSHIFDVTHVLLFSSGIFDTSNSGKFHNKMGEDLVRALEKANEVSKKAYLLDNRISGRVRQVQTEHPCKNGRTKILGE